MYEKEKQELIEDFGLHEAIAEDLLASRGDDEIKAIMVFLRRYGHMIKTK